MYKLNELVFETMLESAKRNSNGNPIMKITIDGVSYEYNRQQYNDCLQHINEENSHIEKIYNQISQRGGFVTYNELQELQRHIQMRNGYETKSMKHLLSGSHDAQDMQSNINKMFPK